MFVRKRTLSTNCRRSISGSPNTISLRPGPPSPLIFVAVLLVFAVGSLAASDKKSDGVSTKNLNAADTRNPPGSDSETSMVTSMGDLPFMADPAGAVLAPYRSVSQPIRPRNCLLIFENLCRALKNKPIVVLGLAQTTTLVSDGVTTRQFLKHGYVEVDPVTRLFIGSKPTWARMAPLGVVQVMAGMWLAERMAGSHHSWIRRLWWLPQMIGIAGNAAATANNLTLH